MLFVVDLTLLTGDPLQIQPWSQDRRNQTKSNREHVVRSNNKKKQGMQTKETDEKKFQVAAQQRTSSRKCYYYVVPGIILVKYSNKTEYIPLFQQKYSSLGTLHYTILLDETEHSTLLFTTTTTYYYYLQAVCPHSSYLLCGVMVLRASSVVGRVGLRSVLLVLRAHIFGREAPWCNTGKSI